MITTILIVWYLLFGFAFTLGVMIRNDPKMLGENFVTGVLIALIATPFWPLLWVKSK